MAETNQTPEAESLAVQQELNEVFRVRREKLKAYQDAGCDPFMKMEYPVDAYSNQVKDEFDRREGTVVSVAGRITGKRVMGKASFVHILDGYGTLQIYVRRDDVGEEAYADFKRWDIGDIAGFSGKVFRTQTGEVSVHAESVTLLSKSLRPLPEKWHGLKDQDLRYRQRYVDLIVNPEVKETFVKRSRILRELRAYLDAKGFLEVDTPILTPFEIGASARPFVTHHNTLDMDMYLRIETELYLKRLIVGGFDRVYEVGRIFRNEGMDPKHNPEFTTIELYQAYTDYKGMMDLVIEMNTLLAEKICGSAKITYQGKEIDMGHWEKLTMVEAVKKYSGADYYDWKSDEDAVACAKALQVDVPANATRGTVLAELFDAFVEEKLIQPTIIYDYPVEMSPLTKMHRSDPGLTERFELFVNGKEVANAYSELNDPIDQLNRFKDQLALQERGDDEAMFIDYDFVRALEYGMPPTSGMGIGIDRLCMFLTNSPSIQDVLLFPQMKPEKVATVDADEKFIELGIPADWVAVVRKAGYQTVEALRAVENPNKLHQELSGLNKKMKLGLKTLSPDEVKSWIK